MPRRYDTINPHAEYVPTSHYHLPLRYVLLVGFICGLLFTIVCMFFLFVLARPDVSPEQLTALPLPMHTNVNKKIESPQEYPDNAISLVYPPEYQMVEKESSMHTPGMLREYVFHRTEENSQLPILADFVMQTADALAQSGLPTADFDAEKTLFASESDIKDNEIFRFNDRVFYVHNIPSDTGILRSYMTFVNTTRLEIHIGIPSPSLSMQADELFRQLFIISKGQLGNNGSGAEQDGGLRLNINTE